LSLDEIGFGYQISNGVPLLLINEPMLIEKSVPNSDVQYNADYRVGYTINIGNNLAMPPPKTTGTISTYGIFFRRVISPTRLCI